jgi:enoyl-CoA hydratase/carnithine racemase
MTATKRLLERSDGTLDELLAAELEEQIALLGGHDFSEGRAAFFERRTARFEGH